MLFRSGDAQTTRRLAQKQPSFKECVIAHWSRIVAPKIQGAKPIAEAWGLEDNSNSFNPSFNGLEDNSESVGERCMRGEVNPVRIGGLHRRENAGMSSEKCVRITLTGSPRVPGEG